MAGQRSAGLLLFRGGGSAPEVLIGHMGGPFWQRRDAGAWTIPKGEYGPQEDPLHAARREFEEELGLPPPAGPPMELGSVRQAGGKAVTVWALEGDVDIADAVLGTFTMEWPIGSGNLREFPELDRVAWFGIDGAAGKVIAGQRAFLDRLARRLAG